MQETKRKEESDTQEGGTVPIKNNNLSPRGRVSGDNERLKLEGSASAVTQVIYKEKDGENEKIAEKGIKDTKDIVKTHGKRKRDGGEIREIKKFKWSSGEIKKTAISIYDTDTQAYVYFPCFFEDSEDSSFVTSGEYAEDDCPTSPCQRKHCQEFLGKELEEAIISA